MAIATPIIIHNEGDSEGPPSGLSGSMPVLTAT